MTEAATQTSIPTAASLAALGDERFVSLTTFRKSGAPVATPVWVAADGDRLVVTTPAGSGKVKRLAHTPRVELRPCSRSGRVEPGTRPAIAQAVILDEPHEQARLSQVIRRKYGVEYRLVMAVETLLHRGRAPRVIIRIGD